MVRWNPDPDTALEETKFTGVVDYFVTNHMFETTIEGQRFQGKICLLSDTAICHRDFKIFSIENTVGMSMLYSESSGYFGLGLGEGYGGGKELNTLNQMVSLGLIDDKKFGVYTTMKNKTGLHSQIRFGGFNRELFADKH